MCRVIVFRFMVFQVWCTLDSGVRLLFDSVHDEVFVEGSGLVLMECGVWCFSEVEVCEILGWLELGVLV